MREAPTPANLCAVNSPADGPRVRLGGLREAAPGYYAPDERDRRRALRSGLVVLDTNILLHLYRLTAEARQEMLAILRTIGDRLFIPNQVAVEYEVNRVNAVQDQARFLTEVADQIGNAKRNCENQIANVAKRCGSTSVQVKSVQKRLATAVKALDALADAVVTLRDSSDVALPGAIERDPVRDALGSLLAGKVGPPISPSERAELEKIAQDRYSRKVPPGFEDGRKTGNAEGDFMVWSQVLEEAAQRRLPVILVSDDVKADWVRREMHQVVGPHPELIVEMREKAGVEFASVTSEQFLREARAALSAKVSDSTLAEVREASRASEDDEFYRDLLRQPTTLGVELGPGGTFSREALATMFGDDLPELDLYRGTGGLIPRGVMVEFLKRRDLRARYDRALAEIEALHSLAEDEMFAPEERRQRLEYLHDEQDSLSRQMNLVERNLERWHRGGRN